MVNRINYNNERSLGLIFACLENGKIMKHIENKGFLACLEKGTSKKEPRFSERN